MDDDTTTTNIFRSQTHRTTIMFTYKDLLQVALDRLAKGDDGMPDINGAHAELTVHPAQFDNSEDFQIWEDAGGVHINAGFPLKKVAVALEIAQVTTQ